MADAKPSKKRKRLCDETIDDGDPPPSANGKKIKGHNDKNAMNKSSQVWAVRVGWFPGIYHSLEKAKLQIYRYPKNEMRRFEDLETAEEWLSQPCNNQKSAPRSLDREGWTVYLQRTWDKQNTVVGIDEKEEILPWLEEVFEHVRTIDGREVNWHNHPLPQTLIQRQREDFATSPSAMLGFGSPALQRIHGNQPEHSKTAPTRIKEELTAPDTSTGMHRSTSSFISFIYPPGSTYYDPDNKENDPFVRASVEERVNEARLEIAGSLAPGSYPRFNTSPSAIQDETDNTKSLESSDPKPLELSTLWKADPARLQPGKKSKYYGVRAGRQPGIFYKWEDVKRQVDGFPNAVHQSFTGKDDVERYMNHLPTECKYSSCGPRCLPIVQAPALQCSKLDHSTLKSNLRICDCAEPESMVGKKTVECTNPCCKVGTYHAICVGLEKRPRGLDWKCRHCRPQPPSATAIETSGAQQRSDEPTLSKEQANVVKLILEGRNICYTGSAGTGKSMVLQAAVRALGKQGKKVNIIAPSGITALAVGGQTTFSYAGWIPDTFKDSLEDIRNRGRGKLVRRRICKTDVLIIEEISMVDSHAFQRLDATCREARDTSHWDEEIVQSPHRPYDESLAFGGIQVIVTGDFCQLPPVKPFQFCLYCNGDELPGWAKPRGASIICTKCDTIYEDADKWAFQAEAWFECNFIYAELTQIHRQKDEVFISILEKCRRKTPLSEDDKRLLLAHPSNTKDAVQLRPTASEVSRINAAAFEKLPGPERSYYCLDFFHWNKKLHPELEKRQYRRQDRQYRYEAPLIALDGHRFEEQLDVKLDMLVILLVNLNNDAGLVNGAQGKVVGFDSKEPEPLPNSGGEHNRLRNRQVEKFIESREVEEWPIVQFTNGRTLTIYAHCQFSALGVEEPYSHIGRTQIPLLPAWAITIHKSQGMTLSRVQVDLARAFEPEMIYVALSRAKSLDGLEIIRLPQDMDYGPNLVVEDFLKRFVPAGTLFNAKRELPGPEEPNLA